jgi:predicted O-methyltransferase YrrM
MAMSTKQPTKVVELSAVSRIYDRVFARLSYQLNYQLKLELSTQLATHLRQSESVVALYQSLPFRLPLPSMSDWAISPDFACELVREIASRRPGRILELGSGVSTLVGGYALESLGCGTLVSLEHDERWARKTAEDLRIHQLDRVAVVTHAPIVDVTIGPDTYPWYSLYGLPQEGLFDMLVVDGPPGTLHPMARYPALPLLLDRLSPNAVIILDDADRPGEQAAVERWIKEFGPFEIDSPPTQRGMIILRLLGD